MAQYEKDPVSGWIKVEDDPKIEIVNLPDYSHLHRPDYNPPKLPDEGVKFDTGKPRMDLLAPEALMGIAKILSYGANKYEDRNWEKGMNWGRVYGALQRHLNAFWGGEELDEESGLRHIDHAACCIHFLQTYSSRNIGTDDRGGK